MMTQYRVIVSDSPWTFDDRLKMSDTPRGGESNYDVLTTEDLIDLGFYVKQLAEPTSILALWCPSALFPDGLHVMDAWGFKFKQIWTWCKTTKAGDGLAFGMGHHFRATTEHALIGTRGRIKPKVHSYRNAIITEDLPVGDGVDFHPATKHSVKPEALQDALEQMYDGEYLELFARRDRPNWLTVGDECPSTLGLDIRDWMKLATGSDQNTRSVA